MIAWDLILMFTLGLVSSLHCAQMCGPIVLSYSVGLEQLGEARKFTPLVWNHLAYNAGRILTYSLLGGVAGLLGSTMGLLGKMTGLGGMLALTTGSVMLIIGLAMFGVLPGSKLLTDRALQFTRVFLRPCRTLLTSPGMANRFFLGAVLGLLPCGVLYAALVKATATGSALRGASNMLAFGLGTAGALLAIGLFSSAVRGKLNRWNAQLVAASITAMGFLLLWRGTMAGHLLTRMHGLHGHY